MENLDQIIGVCCNLIDIVHLHILQIKERSRKSWLRSFRILIRFNALWHHNVGWLNPSLAACAYTRVIEHVNAVALELTWWLPAWIIAFMVYYCLRISCELGHPIDIPSLLLAFVPWLLREKDCFVKRWFRTDARHL